MNSSKRCMVTERTGITLLVVCLLFMQALGVLHRVSSSGAGNAVLHQRLFSALESVTVEDQSATVAGAKFHADEQTDTEIANTGGSVPTTCDLLDHALNSCPFNAIGLAVVDASPPTAAISLYPPPRISRFQQTGPLPRGPPGRMTA